MEFDDGCRDELDRLEDAQLRRELVSLAGEGGRVRVRGEHGQDWLSFSSNDYLGMAQHPEVIASAQRALADHGVGSGASRLVTGTHPAHMALEEAIAAFKGLEASLAFATGYAAANGFASAFLDRNSIVLLDKLCHASLIDACRMVGAKLRVFWHNDLDKLRALLEWARAQSPKGRVVIMTESIFSMDGDGAPLAEIVALKEEFGALLFIDEAHAVGVLGPQGKGLASEFGLASRVDIHMGTLSKAIGVAGGYLAGSRPMIDVLINRARSFIYSTAPPPALAEAARVALEVVTGSEGEARRARLRSNMTRLANGLSVALPPAAILPWIVGEETKAIRGARVLREAGFFVPAIRYPTVARGAARLRFTVSAEHREEEIDSLTQAVVSYREPHGLAERSRS